VATKYVFITGGVASSLGKGITAASLGRLLKARGYSVVIQKFDPYLNVDPGTMNPYQHGEVFVTEDGAETDLDLGHYERFVDENLTRFSSVTSGQVYFSVLKRERDGGYNGGTVQVIPHITDEIKDKIHRVAEGNDVVITEIGGTVGDIEGQPFLEAIRQFQWEINPEDRLFIHVTLIPYLRTTQELKTKPTQHSVKQLQSQGIQPGMLVLRSDYPIPQDMRAKLALFCNLPAKYIIQNLDAESIYQVPLMLEREQFADKVCEALKLEIRKPHLDDWIELVERFQKPEQQVTIALVGKYIQLHDAYLSVVEAWRTAASPTAPASRSSGAADTLTGPEVDLHEALGDADAIVVPGGFGIRGIEGKMAAARYARENKIPYLGLCLGMQIAVSELARSVAGMTGANSSEFDKETEYPVIDLMPDQQGLEQTGGTMRLGRYDCRLAEGTKARAIYGKEMIVERHRHRYEFNNKFLPGWKRRASSSPASTRSATRGGRGAARPPVLHRRAVPSGAEVPPHRPHPLFAGLVEAALIQAAQKKEAI
jgi:CTP synthase